MDCCNVCKFRVEQIDESYICQQAASDVFQTGDANQRAERTSRVSLALLLLRAFLVHCLSSLSSSQSVRIKII